MAVESNRRYQDLHVAVGNAVHVLSPPVPTGTTLADRLHTVPSRVVEVAMYCIRLGATAQIWLGEDLTVVEPGSRERRAIDSTRT
jgi:hypothetical protein